MISYISYIYCKFCLYPPPTSHTYVIKIIEICPDIKIVYCIVEQLIFGDRHTPTTSFFYVSGWLPVAEHDWLLMKIFIHLFKHLQTYKCTLIIWLMFHQLIRGRSFMTSAFFWPFWTPPPPPPISKCQIFVDPPSPLSACVRFL